jgi:hypothetical protein
VDELTQRLLVSLEQEASEHAFSDARAHLDHCLVCLNRSVELRDDLHAVTSPEPASPRLARRLAQLLGEEREAVRSAGVLAGLRRAFDLRVPAWAVAGGAAALVLLTWVATQHVDLVRGVSTPPGRLTPLHRQGVTHVAGVVSSVRDATANGVAAHVLSIRDASGATYVLFTWGPPTVGPGDAVEIEALFTSVAREAGPTVYQGVVTELRHAK